MQTDLAEPSSLPAFAQRFQSDRDCAAFLATLRWPDGLTCRCGSKAFWQLHSRPRVFECRECGRHVSVTAGTVMHRSKVPLIEWFWAAWLDGQDKRGVSALRLARFLRRRYETVWRLLHKVRAALAEDPDAFPLSGVVEMDESYTGGKSSRRRGGRSLSDPRRGLVALAVERKEAGARNPGIRGSGLRCGDARMAVVEGASRSVLVGFLDKMCAPGTKVVTDGWSAYGDLDAVGLKHLRIVEGRAENASELFPLVHTLFSNLKAWLNGTFHGVTRTWLPAYVAQFQYRFNRRSLTDGGSLWRYVLRRLVRGTWRAWSAHAADAAKRRAA